MKLLYGLPPARVHPPTPKTVFVPTGKGTDAWGGLELMELKNRGRGGVGGLGGGGCWVERIKVGGCRGCCKKAPESKNVPPLSPCFRRINIKTIHEPKRQTVSPSEGKSGRKRKAQLDDPHIRGRNCPSWAFCSMGNMVQRGMNRVLYIVGENDVPLASVTRRGAFFREALAGRLWS